MDGASKSAASIACASRIETGIEHPPWSGTYPSANLVVVRHSKIGLPMSALGQKQTFRVMSALPPKADIGTPPLYDTFRLERIGDNMCLC